VSEEEARAAGKRYRLLGSEGGLFGRLGARREASSQGAADARTSSSFYPALAHLLRRGTPASLRKGK